jgi:hypothetical protein
MSAVGISSRVVAELDAVWRARDFWPVVLTLMIQLWRTKQPGTMVLNLFTSYQRRHKLLELSNPVVDTI